MTSEEAKNTKVSDMISIKEFEDKTITIQKLLNILDNVSQKTDAPLVVKILMTTVMFECIKATKEESNGKTEVQKSVCE